MGKLIFVWVKRVMSVVVRCGIVVIVMSYVYLEKREVGYCVLYIMCIIVIFVEILLFFISL